jgi:hypothetical protein
MPKKLTVLINDELDERFRKAVFETKGMHKGNLTEALEEAMNCWIAKTEMRNDFTVRKSMKKELNLKKP